MTNNEKKVITERALFQRLKRHLEKEDNLILRKFRWDSKWYLTYGPYYTVDENNNITASGIDLEKWARESGVMSKHEILEKPSL